MLGWEASVAIDLLDAEDRMTPICSVKALALAC